MLFLFHGLSFFSTSGVFIESPFQINHPRTVVVNRYNAPSIFTDIAKVKFDLLLNLNNKEIFYGASNYGVRRIAYYL